MENRRYMFRPKRFKLSNKRMNINKKGITRRIK